MSSPAHEDSEHAILPEAWTWEIVGFNLQREPEDGGEAYLDLTLRRGIERRFLRFSSPRDVQIEQGGPRMTGGLAIFDVRARGLDDVGVRVCDFEASPGAVAFWARSVEERSRRNVHERGLSADQFEWGKSVRLHWALELDPEKPLDAQLGCLKQDLIQANFPSGMTVDVGWYTEFQRAGSFVTVVIRDGDWEVPILRLESTSLTSLREAITAALAAVRSQR